VVALCWFLAVADRTLGQSSSKDFFPDDLVAGWGTNSLYHMEHGVKGAASCATTSCHGGPKAGVSVETAPRGSEYPLWFELDPHAQSWKTISSEKSVQIMTKLGIMRAGKIHDLAGYQNCLACHNTDKNIGRDQITPAIAEGVGCESCHGPSQRWYDRHYQGSTMDLNARNNLGLTDSKPLLQRAKICVTCHVGAKDRDMNHDIIAAGHPALYFDMAVYHEAYPKHWRDRDQNRTDFRSQLWLAGKMAAADAELELLESRAGKSLPVSVWPELANYQCNSCHVTLDGLPKRAIDLDRENLRLGRAPVRLWNLAGFEVLATSDSEEPELMAHWASLRKLLQSPNPDAKLVAAKTIQLRLRWFETLTKNGKPTLPDWSRQNQLELSSALLRDTERSNSWETAAGAYTAVWATHPKSSDGELEAAMNTIRNGILFPKDLLVPSFPRSKKDTIPPTLEEWNASLDRAAAALQDLDRR